MLRPLRWLVTSVVLATPALASAHIHMLSPAPRDPTAQKQGPCGLAGSARGDQVTVVESGSMLELRWEQMYDHASHYRVSFDADGDDDFVDPTSYDDRYTNDSVILDGIPTGAGPFRVLVPLPDIECERCTLQLVQVMYDKGPYEVGTNDLYYQCADLVLKRDQDGGSSGGALDGGAGEGPVAWDGDAGTTSEPTSRGPSPSSDGYGSETPSTQPAGSGGSGSSGGTTCSASPFGGGSAGLWLSVLIWSAAWTRRRRR